MTTRGHFGSGHFAGTYFASAHFREVAVVPAPTLLPAGGGAGASWGGGPFKAHEPGMRRKKKFLHLTPALAGAFTSKIAADITATIVEKIKKGVPADPLEALTREASPDKVKEGVIRALRKRITSLEENIRGLKGKSAAVVSELEGTLADQALEAEELEREVERLEADLRVEKVRASAYRAAQARATELLAGYPEDAPAPGPGKLVIGALAYLAVEVLIPDRMVILKDVGRIAAARVAISGLVDLLR